MVKRKSKAKTMVADGTGGMVAVEDRRFKATGWEVSIDVPKEYADDWFHYFEVECDNCGWGHSEFGQHEPQENSGSITIDTKDRHQLTIIWERKRGGPIKINAASAGAVPFPASDLRNLIERISTQCRAGVKCQFYQRGQLYYDGLPWRGELWLGGTTRLGPPSQQYEDACRGPRIILVDCTVDAAGRRHAGHLFTQHLQEVSAFLALVTGHSISASTRNQHSWTSKVVDGKVVCDVRSIGYVETQIQSQMPVPDEHHAVPLHSVTRPDFSFSPNAMIGATSELSLPVDIIGLWDAYLLLKADQRRRFLQATAKWQEALMQPSDRRTLSFALMVVACEALKPPGREFHHHNINHVIEALLGRAFATRLKDRWFRAQYVRSVHLHLGEFLASEFGSLRPSRFHDPSFDSAARELARITQAAIIEWLRRGGQFSLPPVKRKKPLANLSCCQNRW